MEFEIFGPMIRGANKLLYNDIQAYHGLFVAHAIELIDRSKHSGIECLFCEKSDQYPSISIQYV